MPTILIASFAVSVVLSGLCLYNLSRMLKADHSSPLMSFKSINSHMDVMMWHLLLGGACVVSWLASLILLVVWLVRGSI